MKNDREAAIQWVIEHEAKSGKAIFADEFTVDENGRTPLTFYSNVVVELLVDYTDEHMQSVLFELQARKEELKYYREGQNEIDLAKLRTELEAVRAERDELKGLSKSTQHIE